MNGEMNIVTAVFAFSFLFVGCQSTSTALVPKAERKLTVFSEPLTPLESQQWVEGRRNYTKSLYQSRKDPYFGKSDTSEDCERASIQEEKLPEASDFVGASYLVRTNRDGVVGICDSKEQTHSMRMFFVGCLKYQSLPPKQFQLKIICSNETESKAECSAIDAQALREICATSGP